MKRLLIAVVRLYRLLLSPWVGDQCRFYPTCSQYTIEALERHGAAAGSYLGAVRILRCHPWCAGGHDPVPERFTWAPWRARAAESDKNSSASDAVYTAFTVPMHNSASLPRDAAQRTDANAPQPAPSPASTARKF
jgi:putative membrane protein insertion efficiency factor